MTTKPPFGTGLAADTSGDDSIEDILLPSTKTPAPLPGGTPGPVIKTPGPSLKTPAPVAAANRDPSSALPTIPPPKKEPSGAFPLPGMAPPDAKPGEDVTLIARLSVLDELVEESTKVEPLEAALRAKASTEDEPINLGEQAATQREKALAMAAPTALDRISAAEFEDPGDDDDDGLIISATPGIISVEEDDEEPTASQRPPGAVRTTPAPVSLGGNNGPSLPSFGGALNLGGPTPAPLSTGPKLPAPTPVPGRALHLPTPNGGMPVGLGLGSGPSRVPTPPLAIPAPMGNPAPAAPARSAVFKSVQVPLGGIVACLVAVFGLGFVVGAYMWQGDAQPSVAAEHAPPAEVHAPAELPQRTAAPPVAEQPAAPATPPPVAAPAENPAPAAVAEKPAPAPEGEAKPVPPATKPEPEATKLVRHVAPKPRPVVRKPAPAVTAEAEKPADKPVAKPAAKPAPVASSKPKADKAKGKGWVDPFAE
jgi:nicotinate-nucleotide--dimethylbenzimidazole phosphoribosyltransferase